MDFLELHSCRSSNGYGPNPLSYTEIQAFYQLNQVPVQPWEVLVLRHFDSVYLKCYDEEQDKKK